MDQKTLIRKNDVKKGAGKKECHQLWRCQKRALIVFHQTIRMLIFTPHPIRPFRKNIKLFYITHANTIFKRFGEGFIFLRYWGGKMEIDAPAINYE